jgi:hypothetical protein
MGQGAEGGRRVQIGPLLKFHPQTEADGAITSSFIAVLPSLFHQGRLALWICHVYVRPTLKQDMNAINTPRA